MVKKDELNGKIAFISLNMINQNPKEKWASDFLHISKR